MKKLFFLLILLPAVTFSQENLKKTAEDFVTGYFKMFEDKKWDNITNSFTEDAQIIFPNQYIANAGSSVKSMVERSKTEVTSYKVDVKWISADVMGTGSAMVTVSYLETTERSGNVRVTDNLDVYLLVLKEGTWKIKKLIPQDNYVLIFDKSIDKKYQKGKIGPLPRHEGTLIQLNGVSLFNIEEYKKNGIDAAQLGKQTGLRFAKGWDPSLGFEGLASSFLWLLQTMSPYIEVLERNDYSAKYKIMPLMTLVDGWNVTKQDIYDYNQNIFFVIADHMGTNSTLTEDGKYWILTLSKK